MAKKNVDERFHMTLSQRSALDAWCKWYSARLDRINRCCDARGNTVEDYTGYEQDLFEAFGCSTERK